MSFDFQIYVLNNLRSICFPFGKNSHLYCKIPLENIHSFLRKKTILLFVFVEKFELDLFYVVQFPKFSKSFSLKMNRYGKEKFDSKKLCEVLCREISIFHSFRVLCLSGNAENAPNNNIKITKTQKEKLKLSNRRYKCRSYNSLA